MERAHVLICLRGGDGESRQPLHTSCDSNSGSTHQQQQQPPSDGVTRTSATSVRLEHSAMSPGVASITFERVADDGDAARLFDSSLAPAVTRCVAGFAASLVVAGAPRSGKSFACHGDRQQHTTGLITLALRHIFKELERLREEAAGLEYQVLLGCFHVDEREQLVDLMRSPAATVPVAGSPLLGAEQALMQRATLVTNSAEAVHCYAQAHTASVRATGGQSHFALVVHVETKRANEERVRRGRLVVVDIHGSSVLEPTQWQDGSSVREHSREKPVFSDAHFPVAAGLSKWFGGFIGNNSATYILVTIQKQAQFQQQAIQSLLYACKAKDIKSRCSVTYVAAFTPEPAAATSLNVLHASEADQEKRWDGHDSSNQLDDSVDKRFFDTPDDSLPGSPASTTSSNSTNDFALASNDTICDQLTSRATAIASRSLHTSEKQSVLSQRLLQAYQSVKSSSGAGDPLSTILTPKKPHHNAQTQESTGEPGDQSSKQKREQRFESLFTTKSNFLHAKADAMLKPRANELQALSLLDKLELIHVQYQEVEKALAHETSIKEKCVDRISKLSQTMSFQVAEHEKQMQQVLAEKERLQTQLSAMELKFEGVSNEVEQLQQEVSLVKASRAAEMHVPVSPISENSSERILLHEFASRLERAMEEAKGVVDFKDGVIQDLERRLQETEQANTRLSEELEMQRKVHEQEIAAQLQQLGDLRVQVRSGKEAAARDAARFEDERVALMARISVLSSKVEVLRVRSSGRESEHAATQTDSLAESLPLVEDSETLRELEERLARKTGECVASHAARLASQQRVEVLEKRIEKLVHKLEKKKKKIEKKMNALASERKAQKSVSAQHTLALTQQREEFEREKQHSERETARLRDAIRQHEGTKAELASEIEQLQDLNRKLDKRCAELQQRIDVLQGENNATTDHRQAVEMKYQQQICSLEQSLARRMLEREAHLAAEHDRKMRKMMDRHAAEMLTKEMYDEPTSLSTLGSSGGISESENGSPPRHRQQQQQSIDQLDALIDLKEKQYAKAREATPRSDRKKLPSSSSRQEQKQIAELKKKVGELTQALAVANEQETLAKEHTQRIVSAHDESVAQREHLLEEMNRLKQENWSLSLALQVTERQRL